MPVDHQRITAFLEEICRQSPHPTAQFWQRYWFEAGHLPRLLFLLDKLAPCLEHQPTLLDIGSFGEFPLILRKFFGVPAVHANSLEGDFIGYGAGRLLPYDDPDIEIGLTIAPCDVEHQPLEHADASIDVVTCFEMLEHLRYDPMFFMLEAHRVLRPDGLLMLTTPNASSWDSLARVAGLASPFCFSTYHTDSSGIGHAKEYAIAEVLQLVDQAGFQLEHLETFDALPANADLDQAFAPLKRFVRACDWWQERWRGQTLLIRARKAGPPKMRKYVPLYTENVPYDPPLPSREAAANPAPLRSQTSAVSQR